MKVSINGERFDYDQNRLLMAEMIELEEATGLAYGEWQSGLGRMSAQSMGALAWLLWHRDGRDVSYADIKAGKVELNLADMEFERDEEPPGPTEPPPGKEASSSTAAGTRARSPKSSE